MIERRMHVQMHDFSGVMTFTVNTVEFDSRGNLFLWIYVPVPEGYTGSVNIVGTVRCIKQLVLFAPAQTIKMVQEGDIEFSTPRVQDAR